MVNFQQLIEQIQGRSREHTLEWIANQTDSKLTTISAIKNRKGREPRYELGKALIELEERTR